MLKLPTAKMGQPVMRMKHDPAFRIPLLQIFIRPNPIVNELMRPNVHGAVEEVNPVDEVLRVAYGSDPVDVDSAYLFFRGRRRMLARNDMDLVPPLDERPRQLLHMPSDSAHDLRRIFP